MRRLIPAAILATVALLILAAVAVAQDDGGAVPAASDLGTIAGVTALVTLIMQAARIVVPEGIFDQWAPTIALVAGLVVAVAGAVQNGGTIVPLDVAIIGLAGGLFSQNLNTAVARAVRPPPPPPA